MVAGVPGSGVTAGAWLGAGTAGVVTTGGFGTTFLTTLTLIVDFTFFFFFEVTVTLQEPAFLALITPFLDTVATFFLLDLNLKALTFLLAFLGLTFLILILKVFPSFRVTDFLFNVIFFGNTAFLADTSAGSAIPDTARQKDIPRANPAFTIRFIILALLFIKNNQIFPFPCK